METDYYDKYRGTGLKLTPQRLEILEYLDGNTSHPTAEDIYSAIKQKFPMISLATIYKTMDTLKEKGYVQELTIDRERRHFDPDCSQHHHLICTTCRKIADITHEFLLDIPDDQKSGFDITGSHIEFYGICPDCKNK